MAAPVNVKNADGSYTGYAPGYEPKTEAPVASTEPVISPIQINRTVDTAPSSDPVQKFADTFTPPETADQIAERKRKDSAALIDSINNKYDTEVQGAQKTGDERLSIDNATSVLSGLMGSTEAGRTRSAVLAANDKEIQAINAKRAVELTGIYSNISRDAETEAQQQLTDAHKSADEILARRATAQASAVANIKSMAATGLVDFDAFKSNPKNQQVYQYALDSVGGSEDALRGVFLMNRPKDQIVGTPQRIGDKYVQAYENPVTGKVNYESISLPVDLPDTYSTFQKIGDSKSGESLIALPANWDGDMSKVKTVFSTHPPQAAGQADGTGVYNGDFAATIKLAAQQGGTNAQRAAIENDMQTFIANGDYQSAYTQVLGSTSKGLTGANASNFQQRNGSLGVLNDLKTAIKAYADAGGKTNIFKGTADQISNKIGTLATDPEYASLATQLYAAFQQYRLNMTGAAFGAAESREYASILPNPGNTLDLNLAKLDGAQKYLNSTVESDIRSVVGQGGVEIKKYAEGAVQGSSGSDLKAQVAAQGYDYDKMRADGHSDAEIKDALGL